MTSIDCMPDFDDEQVDQYVRRLRWMDDCLQRIDRNRNPAYVIKQLERVQHHCASLIEICNEVKRKANNQPQPTAVEGGHRA